LIIPDLTLFSLVHSGQFISFFLQR
jgi:hypothetical protein